MRVLVVEDDEKISSFVSKGLKQAGFAVDQAGDGEEGLFMALNNPYDVAVIDLMLPGRDGLSLIEELRKKRISTPVLILSARSSVDDKVKGLQTGGDDYLSKPFSFSELLARVQALLRRSSLTVPVNKLRVGDLEIDLLKREVRRGEALIDLRPREYALLEYLIRNAGTVVSKTMILEHVWDYHFDPQTNVVDVLIHRLRSKIDEGCRQKLIHTVRGSGYVIKDS
ncbi:MAG: response regulator transcription factor [Spirochaetaceae bacterium]|nr:MAG: response regulator transcription factor [Spirochaetaceae bacterium]